MSPSDYAEHGSAVAEAFKKYLQTGDEKIISEYSIKELRSAVSMLSPYYNSNKMWYRQIEKRIASLENYSKTHTDFDWGIFNEKVLPKVILFLLGVVVGVVFS